MKTPRLKMLSISLLLCLCMALCLIPATHAHAAGPVSEPVKTSNEGDYEYTYQRWANPIRSYLVPNADGTFTRVECANAQVIVETYNSDLQFVSGFTMDMELPLFGGFYSGTNQNFLVFGQNNIEESNETEVIRVVSYTKDWQRINDARLYGANTSYPFKAGSLRFAEYNGYLYIRTAHEMYTSDDDLRHQANMMLNIRISDMAITDSFYAVANITMGYASHSFNQFIAIDGTDIICVDHGDAHPRSVVLVRYLTPAGQDKFSTPQLESIGNGYYQYVYSKNVDVLPIAGATGSNDTGVSLGGFEVSDNYYLIAGNTVLHDETYNPNNQRNIFVSATSKTDFTAAGNTINYLTSYTQGDGVTLSNPHFAKVSDNRFIVIWTETTSEAETMRYAFVDGSGKLIGTIYSGAGLLSDCKPVVSGGKVIWYVTNASGPAFFTIDLNDPDTVTHDHLYSYSYKSTPTYYQDGALISTCSICGETGPNVVIPSFRVLDDYEFYAAYYEPTCTAEGAYIYRWKDADFYGVVDYIYNVPIPATGHNYVDGTCSTCGEADPDYSEPVTGSITLTGVTLSLEDEVLYNLYFTTSDMTVSAENMGLLVWDSEPTNATINGGATVIPGATASGSTYMVQTEGIPGKNLGDNLYLVAYAQLDNGSYVYSKVLPYSAKSYCMSRLDKSSDAKLKALCVALLNYGAAAQEYFAATSNYTYSTLMNADLTAEQQALVQAYNSSMMAPRGTVTAAKAGVFGTTNNGYSMRSASMSADGIFSINYYFTTANATSNVTMYYWNEADFNAVSELTVDNATGSKEMTPTGTANQFWADIDGIAAKDLDKTIYACGVYTVDGTTYSTGVIPYSLGHYCSNKAEKGGDEIKLMAAATAVYSYYAKLYFNK